MAQFFDLPEVQEAASSFNHLCIEASDRASASLFGAWMKAELQWGDNVTIEIKGSEQSAPIARVSLTGGSRALHLRLAKSRTCVESAAHGGAVRRRRRVVSLGDESLTALLTEELRIRSRDRAFERALAESGGVMSGRNASASSVWAPWAAISRSTSSRAACRSRSGTWRPEWVDDVHARPPGPRVHRHEDVRGARRRARAAAPDHDDDSRPGSRSTRRSRSSGRCSKPGDVLIDGGNSWFEDTRRREAALRAAGHPLRRLRRVGRRGRRALRPVDHAGRLGRGVGAIKDVLEAIAAQDRGGPVRHARRPRRRRALRQDGPQRHRVRRHAAHRRGLGRAAPRPRPDAPRRRPTSSTNGIAAGSSRSSSS